MNQIVKMRELMEFYKDENPLVTLRSCVAKCNNEINNCASKINTQDFNELELTLWVSLYDYFADKTTNFNKYLDQFRVWQNYDENIRYCYIKDFAHNYNLQIISNSCELHMRFDTEVYTLDDAVKHYKADSRYKE
jgi:hypothetical protein